MLTVVFHQLDQFFCGLFVVALYVGDGVADDENCQQGGSDNPLFRVSADEPNETAETNSSPHIHCLKRKRTV
jgi:hypothetical protein